MMTFENGDANLLEGVSGYPYLVNVQSECEGFISNDRRSILIYSRETYHPSHGSQESQTPFVPFIDYDPYDPRS